ncbi:Amino acid permease 2 [Picochlorum sp. SENEW3]|nr:Amino acid permease 2 [Picochlorum sp. SENEW3]
MSSGQAKLDWGTEISNYLPTENKYGNVFSSSMHIICAIIGIGVLALPSAISYLGWIAGPLLLFVFFLVTLLACSMLASIYLVGDRIHSKYHYAVRDILGRKEAIVLSSVQLAMFFLVNIAFAITGGLSIQQIAKFSCLIQGKDPDLIPFDQSCLGAERGGTWQGILIFGATEILLSLCISEFSENAIGSTVGTVCAVIYSLVAMIVSFCNVTEGAGSLGGISTSAANKIFGIFNALGQLGSAFGVSLILLEVQDTLAQPPSPTKQAHKSLAYSLSTCFLLYILVGTSGYAAKGNEVTPVILDSFTSPRWALLLAYCALLLNMLASFQIFAQALFETVESNIKDWVLKRELRRNRKPDTLKQKDNDEESRHGFGRKEGEQGIDDGMMEPRPSVYGFDCPCEQTVSGLKAAHHPLQGERGSSTSQMSWNEFLSLNSSALIQYATAPRMLRSGFANETVCATKEGAILAFWQRAIVRCTVVLLQILIACIMPFFGAFVGLIGTVNYFPLTIHFPFKMFQKTFRTSRGFDILLAFLWWTYVLITLVAAIGAVRTIVVGFSTYKIFGS